MLTKRMVWELAPLISYENGITCRLESPAGRVERWHRTMKDEFLKYTDPSRIKEKLNVGIWSRT